jgi:hypothetical protein
MQAGNEDASKGRLAVFEGVRCFECRRRHQGGGGLASLWGGLEGVCVWEMSFVWSEDVVVEREMQDAKMETKDYSAEETKGEQSVPRARCEASAADLFPLSPTPAHCEKLNTSQGLRGSGRSRYLMQPPDKTTTHRAACHTRRRSLCCCARYLVPHLHGVTRRHVGQWLQSCPCSLMRNGWTRSVCQSICTESSQGMRDHRSEHHFAISLHVDTSSPPPNPHSQTLHRIETTPHSVCSVAL